MLEIKNTGKSVMLLPICFVIMVERRVEQLSIAILQGIDILLKLIFGLISFSL